MSSYRAPVIHVDKLSRRAHISDLIKIRPVGAELFHEDRRTDMTKLMGAVRNFESAPNKVSFDRRY
jgi:hypothetical protein